MQSKEEIRQRKKTYYEKNKEKIIEKQKKYYAKNKKKILKKTAKYYKKNINKKKEYSHKYDKENRDKRNNYRRNKYNNDPIFRLRHNMCVAINRSLKAKGISKNGANWEKLVGYTRKELKIHIEKLFKNGMTWENRGKWHIDHIVPVSFFKYNSTDDVEFKYCWSLNNLQPLWAEDNISKGDNLIASDSHHQK